MTHIELREDGKLLAWSEPEKPKNTSMKTEEGMFNYYKWQQSCIEARANAVVCADQEMALRVMTPKNWDGEPDLKYWIKEYPYALPAGYKLEIKNVEIPCPDNIEGCEVLHMERIGIISPTDKQ